MAVALPARAKERRRALRHTKRVRRLRVALPSVSVVIALGLIGAAMVPKFIPLAGLGSLSITADGLVMNAPRLAGHLGEGRRYEVVAARAVQSLLNPSRLSLEGLAARLDLGEGQRVTIEGAIAKYDTDTEILNVSEGVTIASTDGNSAQLADATLNLKEGSVVSEGGIRIDSPRGEVRAGAITVLDGGAFLRFTGGVLITINP
ncbi:MAG: hypothetical protein AAF318_15460 [Pseudomonadota bacterium]